ncbi:hypothetical protein TA3x_004831 [Tundrisphaera sp. TA3]|uniref:hypothetical protein n=1 Tax=Tundrisphaera sp. TA3 TaxID=3435775 RepID=UPI003EBD5E8B
MEARHCTPARGRLAASLVAVALLPALAGASHRTRNFIVEAPTSEQARQVAEHAEACRVSIARAWLGQELPAWPAPCPIQVKITGGEAGGLTSFGFHRGKVTDQTMSVEGRLDRILASSLPHEVTHTIFAAFFGGPMPRWADEGASLLSEDGREHRRHDNIVDDLMRRRGNLPLDRLFVVEEYPSDLMGFYGQGYSISRFLIEMGGRPRFLKFVRDGEKAGWDASARAHYGLANVHELDRAWRSWHRVGSEGRALAQSDPGVKPALIEASSIGRPGGQ